MPIVYSLVSWKGTPLAEHANATANFAQVARLILEKISGAQGRMSYAYDDYYFHYYASEGLIVLCMAETQFPRRIAFAFLQQIMTVFLDSFPEERVINARDYDLNKQFAPVLKTHMDKYSFDPSVDKVAAAQGKVDDLKKVMVQNIDTVLERGEKLQILVEKTDQLKDVSFRFEERSRDLKRTFLLSNIKMWAIIILLVLILTWLISSLICGFTYSCLR